MNKRMAGPTFVLIIRTQPNMDLNRDIAISLGGTWPLEIFGFKIIILWYAILHGYLLTYID